MLSKIQVEQAIYWIEENTMDHDLLQGIVSENSNTVQQTLMKYNINYDKLHKKKLTTPMTKNVLLYMVQLYKQSPTTFHKYNMNIENDIVYSDKMQINLPEIIEKIKNENISLIMEKKKLLEENALLMKKYDSLLETKINKSLVQKGFSD